MSRDVALCDGMCDGSHMATKTAAVKQTLTEFITRREQARLLDLFGSLQWDPDFDHKRERARRITTSPPPRSQRLPQEGPDD